MIDNLSALIRRRDLLYMITWREIKIRYKQSLMGFMWAILLPGLIILAGITVRYGIATLSGEPVSAMAIASVSVKALAWAFFASALRFSSTSLVSNTNLVTKIYLPREVFPISAVLAQLFDLAIAASVLVVVLLFMGVGVSWEISWVPLLVVILVALATGWALILSAACLFFRDVKYLVDVFVNFAIFVTPVFYGVEMFGRWKNALMLNPLSPLLVAFENIIVYRATPNFAWLGYSAVFALVVLTGGFYLFKRWEPMFAENI